jgi:hypothetical protein
MQCAYLRPNQKGIIVKDFGLKKIYVIKEVSMTINVSISATVVDGEKMSATAKLDVAHSSLKGAVTGGGHLVFSLQPDSGEKVRMLFITAENYENLSYQIQSDATAPSAALRLKLTEPHLFVGDTVNAINAAPTHLAFWNEDSDQSSSIKVSVLVGRNAIVSQSAPLPAPVSGGPSSGPRKPTARSDKDIKELEKELEVTSKNLADAQKAKASEAKLYKLTREFEEAQKKLVQARKLKK